MKKTIQHLLLIFIAAIFTTGTAHSQLWTAYSPVDVIMSQVGSFSGGCYPNADFTFSFPGSQVAGVDFYFVVTQTPANGVLFMPYGDTLAAGDSLVIMPGTQMYSVFCFAGSGLVSFDIVAKGIPITAGDPYPCSVPLWLSNLLLCPEGLFNGVSFGCAEQISTGMGQVTNEDYNIIFPVDENNYQLHVEGVFSDAFITDMLGRTYKPIGQSIPAIFNMQGMASGVYTLVLVNGSKQTARNFSIR